MYLGLGPLVLIIRESCFEQGCFSKELFCSVGKEITVEIPTGETRKGLYGGEKEITRKSKQWKKTGWSDHKIDSNRLSKDLEEVVATLNAEGYNVQSITPVASGAYDFKYQVQGFTSSARLTGNTEAVKGGASYGYGYSFTDSLIVVAEKVI